MTFNVGGILMIINFNKLRACLRRPQSNITDAKDSSSYSEFAFVLANLIDDSNNMKEDELAMLTMSLQSWYYRKNFRTCRVPVNLGSIFLADLGNCYSPELAYIHPVVILEMIGSLALIVPTSSSPNTVTTAYHPVDNPAGNSFCRKVKPVDGFQNECALLLTNIRTISQGRLLDCVGQLNNINDPNSLFVEIKQKCFEMCFPKQNINLLKETQENGELKNKIDELTKENLELLEKLNQQMDNPK
jgi:mRNA-degrading endonuclease toxin of MazEF toxin-antitoxin module